MMRFSKLSIVFVIGAAFIALPLEGQSNASDTKNNQDQTSTQNQDKSQAAQNQESKKDAKTSGDTVQPERPRTPMDPAAAPTTHTQNDNPLTAKGSSDNSKYSKQPFIITSRGSAAGQQSAPHDSSVPNWKVKDLGDSVRFEFQTPMGPNIWVKKKSDLNDKEKAALASATPPPAPDPAPTSNTPAASSAPKN